MKEKSQGHYQRFGCSHEFLFSKMMEIWESKKDIFNGEDLNFNNLIPAPTSFKFGNLLRISQQSILL